MKRLIIDSLRFWVREMHVDGFRFDLAPALGAKDEAWTNCPTSSNEQTNMGITWDPSDTVVQDIVNDPVLLAMNTRFIAEPWGAGGYPVGQFPTSTAQQGIAWAEWNGSFRDWAREWVKDDAAGIQNGRGDGGNVLLGTSTLYQGNGRKPFHSINYVTIHDGFTMYDLVSYDAKVNDCSPLNPICCTDPLSTYCDEAKKSGTDDNISKNWVDEDLKRQIMRDFFTLIVVAQGTPMIEGGDEWMRTQLGNNNTYTPEADNPYSWHDWGAWLARDEKNRMHDFVKNVLQFRKDHAWALAPTDYGQVVPTWLSPTGGTPDWANGRQLMVSYAGDGTHKAFVVMMNMGTGTVQFNVPGGGQWRKLIDTQSYFDTADYLNTNMLPLRTSQNISLQATDAIPGNSYGVSTRSIVVLEQL
jgi:glycogen operon protein